MLLFYCIIDQINAAVLSIRDYILDVFLLSLAMKFDTTSLKLFIFLLLFRVCTVLLPT